MPHPASIWPMSALTGTANRARARAKVAKDVRNTTRTTAKLANGSRAIPSRLEAGGGRKRPLPALA